MWNVRYGENCGPATQRYPCQRFALHRTMQHAWLGDNMNRYSFVVRDSHPLLLTDLSRRTDTFTLHQQTQDPVAMRQANALVSLE